MFSGILQPRHLFVRRQGHEHCVVPNICNVQLCHVVLLKKKVGVFLYLHFCVFMILYSWYAHPTHLIFSTKECELAEWVSIVSRMKQSYLHIQKSAGSSHKMWFNHSISWIGKWLVQQDWSISVWIESFFNSFLIWYHTDVLVLVSCACIQGGVNLFIVLALAEY